MARAQGIVSVVWSPDMRSMPPRHLVVPANSWVSNDVVTCSFRTLRDLILEVDVVGAVAVEATVDGVVGNLPNRVRLLFASGFLSSINRDLQVRTFGAFTGGSELMDHSARIEALANDVRVDPAHRHRLMTDVNAWLALDAATPAHLKFPVDGSIEPVGPPGAPGRHWVRSEMERIMDRDRRINERIVANRANVNINLGNNSVMYTHGTDYLVSDDSVVFRHPPSRGDVIIFDEAIEMMQTPAGKKPLVHVAERVIRPPTMRELWLD